MRLCQRERRWLHREIVGFYRLPFPKNFLCCHDGTQQNHCAGVCRELADHAPAADHATSAHAAHAPADHGVEHFHRSSR